ncbi:hypothetical protein MALG_02495 [Marinovum algicola DG 898]|nr:hypothetical protein MALG_02495 [Marinovum algicola DG 898]
MTKMDLTPRSPVERWTLMLDFLRKARVDGRTMTDVKMPLDVRDQAAARYSRNTAAALAELDALDLQGALHDVPELLDLTYGGGR